MAIYGQILITIVIIVSAAALLFLNAAARYAGLPIDTTMLVTQGKSSGFGPIAWREAPRSDLGYLQHRQEGVGLG